MEFWNLIAVIGLVLAVTAALDYIIKPPIKTQLAQYLAKLGSTNSEIRYGISPSLDRLFGPRLASSKAVWRSVVISLLSLVLTYAFAYFTSELSVVSIFTLSPSWRSVALFALFVGGCVAGDFFSFAQTRVFLRAVDGMRQGIVSIGLALADAVISLAIFVGFFSITRLIAYLIIIGTTPQGTIRQELNINTDALWATISSLKKDGFATPAELEWPTVLSNVRSAKEASKFDEISRQYTNDLVKGETGEQFVSVDVNFKCENNIYSAAMQLDDVINLIAK